MADSTASFTENDRPTKAWRWNRKPWVMKKLTHHLMNGEIAEAEATYKKLKKKKLNISQTQLAKLWKLAVKVSVPEVSKQWLEKQITFNLALQEFFPEHERNIEKLGNFFARVATYNFDLIIQLAQDNLFKWPWEALRGSLQAETISLVDSRATESQKWKIYSQLLTRALAKVAPELQNKWLSILIQEGVNTETALFIDLAMAMPSQDQWSSSKLLAKGCFWAVRTGGTAGIVRTLAKIKLKQIDWQIMRDELEAPVEQIKAGLEKIQLESLIDQVQIAKATDANKIRL